MRKVRPVQAAGAPAPYSFGPWRYLGQMGRGLVKDVPFAPEYPRLPLLFSGSEPKRGGLPALFENVGAHPRTTAPTTVGQGFFKVVKL